jgi:subtilase family serine protease
MSYDKCRAWTRRLVILSLLAGFLAPALITAIDGRALASTGPDLIVASITLSPPAPAIGDTVTFTAVIKNQGDSQAGPSRIAYYIDNNQLNAAYLNQINAGATATNTFTWKAKAGAHVIKAMADFDDRVAETNEDNNDKSFAFSVLAPDLVVEGISWTPESPSIGQKITFTVTVKNQGNKNAGASSVNFYVDSSLLGTRSVPWLEAGDNATATYTLSATPGSHAIEAVADSLHQVNESDETNNDMTVTCETAAPDLVIDAISCSPENQPESRNVTTTVTVKNQGKGTADFSLLALYVDDVYQTVVSLNRLDAGAATTQTFSSFVDAKEHAFKAVADASNQVSESDESNNSRTANISALAPDLIIESITWSPAQPLIAHQMTFTVTVKNQGTRLAGSFDLSFYVDNAYRFHQEMTALPAGATVTMTYPWVTQSESMTLRAVVDEVNYTDESDESNNTKTASVGFSHPSPATDLTIQDITCTPAEPATGETVTFTVDIKNQGPGQAGPFHIAYYVDDALLDTTYVNQINPGAIVNNTTTWQAEPGEHKIRAVIDCNNSVAETDESNNERTITLITSDPDLTIQDVTWSPINPGIGDEITFTLTIKNQGKHKAGGSYIDYFVDNSYQGNHYIEELEPGATVTRTFSWETQAESHIFRAVLDKANSVLESNEANNEKTVILPAPDLTIDSITCSPDSPAENTLVTITVSIRNLGKGHSGSTLTACYIDGDILTWGDIDDISPGGTATGTFYWIARPGEHIIRLIADEKNNAIENDEHNNEKESVISIPLPTSTENATLEPVPEVSPAVTTELKEPEEAAKTIETSQIPPAQESATVPDISDNISQSPSTSARLQGILMNRWFIIGIGVVGVAAITLLLRFRKKASKK